MSYGEILKQINILASVLKQINSDSVRIRGYCCSIDGALVMKLGMKKRCIIEDMQVYFALSWPTIFCGWAEQTEIKISRYHIFVLLFDIIYIRGSE